MCDSPVKHRLPKLSACVIQNFLGGTNTFFCLFFLLIRTTSLCLQLKPGSESVTPAFLAPFQHLNATAMTSEEGVLFV